MHASNSEKNRIRITSESEHFFRMSLDMLAVIRFDGTIIKLNDAWEKVTGYSITEIIATNGMSLVHPDDQARAKEELDKLITGHNEVTDFELRTICKNGEIKYISWNSTVDAIKGLIYSIGRDVTHHHEHTVALQANEEKFKFLSDNAFEGICVTIHGIIESANKAYLKITGVDTESEVLGKSYLDFVDKSINAKVKEMVDSGYEGVYECIIKRKDGLLKNVEVLSRKIIYRGIQARIAVLRDLDERRKAQEMLLETEMRLHAMFQNTAVGILLIDMDGNIIEANDKIVQRLGYSRDEFITMQVTDILNAEERSDAVNYFENLVRGKTLQQQSERKFEKKDGTVTWSRISCNLLQVTPKKKFVLALIEDIDNIKNSELALSETEEKFRAVFESSPMGILITKKPGTIIDVNPAYAEMLGFEREELIGKNVLDFTYSLDVAKSKKWLEQIYTQHVNTYSFETRYIRKDKAIIWVKAVVSLMNIMADDITTVAIIENIDKKKKTEQTLELKNRELTQTNLELEHFAYVASHDLQEPLRTITSFIQILDRRYTEKLDKDGQQFMGFVVEGAKRMQNLIHDLLEYSRINRYNTNYETLDLNEVFHTVNRVLKDKIDSNDAIVLAEHLPVIQGNKIQITQVFQNLIDNAIKFRGKKKPEIFITVNELTDKWQITFKDNGIGISPEYFQRIFVIFQRLHTPDEYTGTGIGLAICKKIIERHGGEIRVESKPGKGSAFYVTLAKNLSGPPH